MFFVLMFIDINHIILFILNTWFCWLKTFNQNPDFLRRNFAPKRVVMVKPSACDIVAVADAARPQRSTPYFSVSQQQIAYRRERSPKRSGHGVAVVPEPRYCPHYSPMIGLVRGQFGPSTISMPFSCCYKEAELMEWTNEAKCQILDFCRRAEEEQTETDPVFTTLFTKPNLVLSWMDHNHLEKLPKVLPKVNIIFYFRERDGRFYAWEQWARKHNVFLVFQDPEFLVSELNSNNVDEVQDVKRRMFVASCTQIINTLNTFLKYEARCSVCKEERVIHAAFVCDGTSKSVAALLANTMFFGDCDATTAVSHLLQKPRVWKPMPLIEHSFMLEALFHLEHCIRAAIGR